MNDLDYAVLLQPALEEARRGFAEGGVPVGAALLLTHITARPFPGRRKHKSVKRKDAKGAKSAKTCSLFGLGDSLWEPDLSGDCALPMAAIARQSRTPTTAGNAFITLASFALFASLR